MAVEPTQSMAGLASHSAEQLAPELDYPGPVAGLESGLGKPSAAHTETGEARNLEIESEINLP